MQRGRIVGTHVPPVPLGIAAQAIRRRRGAGEIHGVAAVQRRYDQRRNVSRQTVLDHAPRRRRRQWLVEHKLAVVPDRCALRRHQYEGITEAQAGNDGTR